MACTVDERARQYSSEQDPVPCRDLPDSALDSLSPYWPPSRQKAGYRALAAQRLCLDGIIREKYRLRSLIDETAKRYGESLAKAVAKKVVKATAESKEVRVDSFFQALGVIDEDLVGPMMRYYEAEIRPLTEQDKLFYKKFEREDSNCRMARYARAME
jgi:hypothetical protein